MTPAQSRQYIDECATLCPYCRDADYSSDPDAAPLNTIHRKVDREESFRRPAGAIPEVALWCVCAACHAGWVETYTLSGVV